jgi:hypothetical protein
MRDAARVTAGSASDVILALIRGAMPESCHT